MGCFPVWVMDVWTFLVNGWELGDTLGDLRRGQQLESLPLAFYPLDLRHSEATEVRSGRRVRWNEYAVTAQVVFCGKDSWVLDFGLPAACSERARPPVAVGSLLEGTVRLFALTAGVWGQDLFEAPAPPLNCTWRIDRIWLETTPWRQIGTGSYQRADVPQTFVELAATNYAADDSGRADYLLDCRLLEGPYVG